MAMFPIRHAGRQPPGIYMSDSVIYTNNKGVAQGIPTSRT